MADTIYSSAGDGEIRGPSAPGSWSAARSASTGSSADGTSSQAFGAYVSYDAWDWSTYAIARGYLPFDLSSIPSGSVITAIDLVVKPYAVWSGAGGYLCVCSSSQASLSSLATSDYGNTGGSTEYASRTLFSAFTANTAKTISLNASAISAATVGSGGKLLICLRASQDLDNSQPSSGTYSGIGLDYSERTGTADDPYLLVTYSTAVTASDSGSGTEGGGTVVVTIPVAASDSAAASDSSATQVAVTLTAAPTNGIADDFTGSTGTAIESRSPTGTNARGAWTRLRGTVIGTVYKNNASGRAYLEGDPGGPVSADYRGGSDTFADGFFEADFYIASSSSDYQSICVRHNGLTGGSSTYYWAVLDNGVFGNRGRVTLNKVILGVTTELGHYDIPSFATGNTYLLRLTATGSAISVSVDGTPRITATDTAITAAGYPVILGSTATSGGSTTGIHFDNVNAGTPGAAANPSDSAAATDTASRTTASTPVSASDSGAATDTASTSSVATPVSASDSATGTDTSSATRFVSTRPGTPQTRAASGSPVTLFPSNGVAGTHGSHYGLPDGIMLPDGTLMVVARKSGGHSVFSGSARGRIVAKTKPPGGSWSAEATILDTAYDERDPCLGLLADGTVCLTWNRLDLDGKAYNADNGDTKFYAPFMKCPAGSDPLVAANWTTPVNITGAGLANNWRVGTDILELTPGGRIVVALYGTPTYPSWVRNECWIGYSDDGGATWGMLSQLDDGAAHSLHSSGEAQLVKCGDGSVLACYRTIASPWETWARRSTDQCATWSSEWRIATNSVNKTGMVRTPDGDVIIAFNNLSEQLTIAQSFDEGTTFTTTVLGNTGNLYAQPFFFGTQGVGPNAAVVYSYETSGQSISSVYYQELTAGASPAVGLNDAATATDTAGVQVGVGAIPKTATDTGTGTDTGAGPAVTRFVTATDSGIGIDYGGGVASPVASFTRPFYAPLDVASATAPLDVVAATAPLDLTYTETT